MNRGMQRLIRDLETQGFRVTPKRKGWMIFPPDPTKPAVTVHSTPSDRRAADNYLADLRRAGYIPSR